ncbi:MAG: rpoE [Acidobacteria bacterium]|nr:rpoE [Acidobacteriota bacterium]
MNAAANGHGRYGFGIDIRLARTTMARRTNGSMATLLPVGRDGPSDFMGRSSSRGRGRRSDDLVTSQVDILPVASAYSCSAPDAMAHLPPAVDPELDPVAHAYRAHAQLLWYVGLEQFHVPREEVGALVNDVFVSYLRHHARVRAERAWLVGAMRNACAEYWRVHGRTGEPLGETREAVDEKSEAWDERLDISRILAELAPKCRTALRLRYYDGLKLEELAGRLAITVNNAKQVLHRCTAAARALFAARHGRHE